MKNYNIKGFIIKKNFFTEKEISNFGKNYSSIYRKNPVMLFNKKNLTRLKYAWHQESIINLVLNSSILIALILSS